VFSGGSSRLPGNPTNTNVPSSDSEDIYGLTS